MAVIKHFWEDPYCTKIKANVKSSDSNVVTLDRTIFFAQSGGQASDSGLIGGRNVLNAELIDKEIFYTLESGNELKSGDVVDVEIDWSKRYKLMKLHFAAEIVLELINQNCGRPEKKGANINEKKARIDFSWEGSISEIIPEIQAKANEIITADLNIVSSFSNVENEIRFWRIENFAEVPCGGTHPKSTGEIDAIRLKREHPGKNLERIEIYLCK